ncbi:MAG TPA: ABC transporter permease [Candidatus Scalindua sp.]|nr:ABC transporter permease [Candidatus Scalindua sp.]
MKAKSLKSKDGALFFFGFMSPALFVIVLGIVPLVLIIIWSFFEPTEYWIRPHLTIAAYLKFFTMGRYITFLKTLRVSVTVTFLALIIGYPIAYFIRKVVREKYRNIILFIFIIPFFLSYIVRVFSLRLILGRYGVINNALLWIGLISEPIEGLLFNEVAVHIGLLSSYLPFMIFPIVLSIERVGDSTVEASRDMGATFFQTLIRIIIPLTKPGIFAGCIFVFVSSLGSTVEWDLLGGVSELSTQQMLESLMSALKFPSTFAISTLILAITMGALLLGFRYAKIGELFETLE